MASISGALLRIKGQLAQFVPEQQVAQTLQALGYRWRKRALTPALTVQLLLLQLLANVALGGLRRLADLTVTSQAISKAYRRLPLALWYKLVEAFAGNACTPKERLVFGRHRLILADAMSFLVPDTPELSRRYGKAKNGRGTSLSYPVPKLVALVDGATGLILKVIALPWHRQERACLVRLFQSLIPGDLVLGDRGLTGFVQFALLLQKQLHALMRLPRNQAVRGKGKTHHRLKRRLGRQDLLVQWIKDRRPAWISALRFEQVQGTLCLRQIAFRIVRPGYRTHWAWLITTLTDPVDYPAQELVTLYGKRWQVEVYFRDLKQTLNFKKLSARSIQGIRKQILGMVIIYNMIRSLMQEAAVRQAVAPDRISFKDAVHWLLWAPASAALPRLVVRKKRIRATQPRRIKTCRKRFPHLASPRNKYLLPPSRVCI